MNWPFVKLAISQTALQMAFQGVSHPFHTDTLQILLRCAWTLMAQKYLYYSEVIALVEQNGC